MGKQRKLKKKLKSRSSAIKSQKRVAANYRVLNELKDNEARLEKV